MPHPPRKKALYRRVNVEGSILLERRCENVRALSLSERSHDVSYQVALSVRRARPRRLSKLGK